MRYTLDYSEIPSPSRSLVAIGMHLESVGRGLAGVACLKGCIPRNERSLQTELHP